MSFRGTGVFYLSRFAATERKDPHEHQIGRAESVFGAGARRLDIAKAYAPKEIYKKALAAKFNGETIDLFRPLMEDGTLEFLTFEDADGYAGPLGTPLPTCWPRR